MKITLNIKSLNIVPKTSKSKSGKLHVCILAISLIFVTIWFRQLMDVFQKDLSFGPGFIKLEVPGRFNLTEPVRGFLRKLKIIRQQCKVIKNRSI